jgi:hypothetical protein
LIADDVAQRMQKHGDPWRLSEGLSPTTGNGYSTATRQKKEPGKIRCTQTEGFKAKPGAA